MPVCEICSSTDFKVIATEIREGEGRIMECGVCHLVIQDLGWSAQDLSRYYNEEYQETNSLDADREQSPREHFEDRMRAIGPLAEQVRPLLGQNMRVLDVGCGAGELLASIKGEVCEVVGVELNQGFVDFMNDELGIEAHAQDVNQLDLGGRAFDLILSIATLDHLPNPLETVRTMRRLLAPGGTLYIEVPNRDEALNHHLPEESRRRFNRFFWHRAHLFYFTRDTLALLLDKAGLTADITCRHEYTLLNYMNWYLTGTPMKTFVEATTGVAPFEGTSRFERGMNELFQEMEGRFHALMSDTSVGDTLCCVARAADGAADGAAR